VTLRLQDLLFGLFSLAVLILMAFHLGVAAFALTGAFVCGGLYLFAGMLPPREQRFSERAFTSVFLACVLASLVLILPGTLGAPGPAVRRTVLVVAGLIPIAAFCFEVLRSPQVIRILLRWLDRG